MCSVRAFLLFIIPVSFTASTVGFIALPSASAASDWSKEERDQPVMRRCGRRTITVVNTDGGRRDVFHSQLPVIHMARVKHEKTKQKSSERKFKV